MKINAVISVILALAAASSGGNQQEFVVLKLNLEPGQVFHFVTFSEVRSTKTIYRQENKSTLTVKSYGEGQYVLSTMNFDIQYELADGRQIPGIDSTVEVTQSNLGKVLDLETDTNGDDDKFLRNPNHLVYPDMPVTIGSNWSKEVPADLELGTPANTIFYSIAGRRLWRGYDVFVINFWNDPQITTPMPMTGTAFIDISSGLNVFMDATFENLTDPNLKVAGRFRTEIVRGH